MGGLHGRVDIPAIKARMRERNIKQADLARHLGLVPNKITKAFKGERRFTVGEMHKIRELLSDGQASHAKPLRAIPIIGQVAAGNWREAIRHPLSSMPQPDPSIPARAFALLVAGDSMDQLVDDGGVVVIDPEDKDLYPGRYYVVINASGETTFKRFEISPARLVPCSTNPGHQPISIGSGEGFEVLGRVIWRAARM